jgi:hypothetical protein
MNDPDHHAEMEEYVSSKDLLQERDIEIERLTALVRSAYSEGFSEGMNEHTKFSGGKPWADSQAKRALEEGMSDILEEMRKAAELRGDTYSSMEIWGLLGRGVAEIERLRDLVRCLIENDPDEPIADNGMTVLDQWRKDARRTLEGT